MHLARCLATLTQLPCRLALPDLGGFQVVAAATDLRTYLLLLDTFLETSVQALE